MRDPSAARVRGAIVKPLATDAWREYTPFGASFQWHHHRDCAMADSNIWILAFLWAVAAYAALGAVLGAISLFLLAPRADPNLRVTPLTVRLLFLPGVIAVWPLAIQRWRRAVRTGAGA